MSAGYDPDLRRVIQTLLATDDYKLRAQSDTAADLTYIHNDPPHPVIHIEIRQPAPATR